MPLQHTKAEKIEGGGFSPHPFCVRQGLAPEIDELAIDTIGTLSIEAAVCCRGTFDCNAYVKCVVQLRER